MKKLKHPGICIYMSISEKHLSVKLEKSYDQALKIIEDVVKYCKHDIGFSTVAYTAEDATSTSLERLVEVANLVKDAGGDIYRVADTKGQMLPENFGKLIKGIVKNTDIPIDIHCHNDFNLALANSLAGLEAGASGVHTTVLGLGERAGITSFSGLVAILEEGYGYDTKVNKEKLYELGKYVSAISEVRISPREPILGSNIFLHKAGTHQKSVLKDPSTYEPFKPEVYGRNRGFEVGPMVSKELIKYMFEVDMEKANNIAGKLREYSAEKGGRPLKKGEVRRLLVEKFGIEKNSAYLDEGFSGIVGIKVKPQFFSGAVAKSINRISLDKEFTISKIFNVTGEFELWVVIGNCKDQKTYELVLNKIREIPGVERSITMTILDEY
jgi:2-isopropylmalate synthase